MASDERVKDLDLTEDEVKRLTEAFKKDEFRKLFAEYAEEISNPENRKRYEAEIAQLEAERGMNVKFVQPEPGHVIKTTVDGETKAFINVCKNEHIEKPSANKQKTQDGRFGLQWSIPHSFAPPREDTDKSGNKCKVFDVVFHPDTYRMGETNVRFRKMLHDTAFDGIERQFEVTIDRKNLKFPKMKFKGVPTATVIRTKSEEKPKEQDKDDIMNNFPYPYDDKTTEEKSKEQEAKIKEREVKKLKKETNPKEIETDPYTRPKYSIKHRNDVELDQFRNAPDARPSSRPKELVIEIDLPLLKSAAPVDLDIFEKQLVLKSEEPAKYKLDLSLPYPVDENDGSAKFDKSKKRLIVTLPVLPDKTAQSFFEEIYNVGKIPEGVTGDQQCGLNEEGKPLIEVLSSTDDNLPPAVTDNEVPSVSSECEEKVQNGDVVHNEKANTKDIWTEEALPERKKVIYTLPEYGYDQDVGTVSLVMHVKNVESDSVVKSFPPDDQKQIRIKFISMGSGCFPIHYSMAIKFDEGCNIIAEDCTVDVSADNVVVILAKAKLSWSWWDKFEAGVDENNLQEKYFITEKTLKVELDELGGAPIMPAEQASNPELQVTELNTDHVTVEIKDKEEVSVPSSPESDIEIVHERVPPRLHSILKQRSRTTSESSDEVFSSSFSRENSITTSESPISEGDEEHSGGGRKKSVSFSEQVDKTCYKSNASVSALHSTLKNRRKKARKREEKRSNAKGGRRRRTSSGGSCSSDDLPNAGKPEEFELGDDDIDPHTLQQGFKEDEKIKSSHTPQETKPQKKESKSAVQKQVDPKNTNVRRDEYLREDSENGKKVETPAEPGDVVLQGGEPPVNPTVNSISDVQDTSANKINIITENEVFRDPKPKSGGDNAPDTKASPNENGSNKKSKNKRKKNKNKQVELISGGSGDEDDKSEGEKMSEAAEEKDEETSPKADTMLKWEESKQNGNEHKTQCAFQFSNSLMYDLDED